MKSVREQNSSFMRE